MKSVALGGLMKDRDTLCEYDEVQPRIAGSPLMVVEPHLKFSE